MRRRDILHVLKGFTNLNVFHEEKIYKKHEKNKIFGGVIPF